MGNERPGRRVRSFGAAAVALLLAPGVGFAHGGGLDAEGCHTNRRTGDYHCHRGGGAPGTLKGGAPGAFDPGRASQARPGMRQAAFANCAEARAAGAAPVLRGQPGYGPHLDRDNDGIGCEPYRGRSAR